MRIKIIGDNNCARATRHLLRLAGFAVTEFLPAEVVTQAPHLGYAITIESFSARPVLSLPEQEKAEQGLADSGRTGTLACPGLALGDENLNRTGKSACPTTAHNGLAPAPLPLNPALALELGASAGVPTSQPDSSTPGQPAAVHGEASPAMGGASSLAFYVGPNAARDGRNDSCDAEGSLGGVSGGEDQKSKQADGSPELTTRAWSTVVIHFDSVDGELEAAVLRHVTQLAASPVVVDRPGGVVHSERELRIILPVTGDARADEAAAVAVEFGVLRGLLDLTRRPSHGELRGGAGGEDSDVAGKSGAGRGEKRKWWVFGGVLLAVSGAVLSGGLGASSRASGARVGKGAQTEVYATKTWPSETLSWSNSGAGFSLRGLAPARAQRLKNCADTGNEMRSVRMREWAKGRVWLEKSRQAEACPTRDADSVFAWRGKLLADRVARGESLRSARVFVAAEPQGQFATGQTGASAALDPCQAQTKSFASINQTTGTQLVAGTASKKIYICSIHVVVAAATSVALVEGTGSVCGTGTAGVSGFGGATAATGWTFMANGGIVLGSGVASVGAEATSADNLCLLNSGSGQVSGGISYVVQ